MQHRQQACSLFDLSGHYDWALTASLLIGLMVNFAVALDYSALDLLAFVGRHAGPDTFGYAILKLKISQVSQILPFLLLVLMLVFRPRGLLGTREG